MRLWVACFGALEGLRRSASLTSGSENVLLRSAEIRRAPSHEGWATLAMRGCAQKTGADISHVVTMDIPMHTHLSFAILARAMVLGKSFDGGSLSNLPHTLPSLPDVALVADLYPCAALHGGEMESSIHHITSKALRRIITCTSKNLHLCARITDIALPPTEDVRSRLGWSRSRRFPAPSRFRKRTAQRQPAIAETSEAKEQALST